ncbi:MAG: hypothetical protein H7X80_03075 [bacterium]|nr:hypothetical protein [Candidatus Kapabacteria bacterium]
MSAASALVATFMCASLVGCDGGDDEVGKSPVKIAPSVDVGTITGRVTHSGTVPQLKDFDITSNADICGTAAKNNLLELGPDNAIVGAVVYVDAVGDERVDDAATTMRQVGCQYVPHVIVAAPGSEVRFVNDDATQHNVRVEDIVTKEIVLNLAQSSKGAVDVWKVPGPGEYAVGCDYHPWMNANVLALSTRHFAITDSTGRFTIRDVPVGARAVAFWHGGIDVDEKRDTDGRLIGYRISKPIALSLATVDVTKGTTQNIDRSIDLNEQSTRSAK